MVLLIDVISKGYYITLYKSTHYNYKTHKFDETSAP